jgi:hypothetical protein
LPRAPAERAGAVIQAERRLPLTCPVNA